MIGHQFLVGLRKGKRHALHPSGWCNAAIVPTVGSNLRALGNVLDCSLLLCRQRTRRWPWWPHRRLLIVECAPRLLADDTIDLKAARVLIVKNTLLRDRPKIPVDLAGEMREHPLQVD